MRIHIYRTLPIKVTKHKSIPIKVLTQKRLQHIQVKEMKT